MKELSYEDFELKQVEIKETAADYVVEFVAHRESETMKFEETIKHTKKIFENSQIVPLFKRLAQFIPTNEKDIELVKLRTWEFGGVAASAKFTFTSLVNNSTQNKAAINKADIGALFGDNYEEVKTVLEEIKLNLYNVLIKGEVYPVKTTTAKLETNSDNEVELSF